MADGELSTGTTVASNACGTCRKQKRKCSKDLPRCRLCERLNKLCDYNDNSTASTTSDEILLLRNRINELEANLKQDTVLNQDGHHLSRQLSNADTVSVVPGHAEDNHLGSPALFFLECEIFKEARLTMPMPTLTTSEEVRTLLGGDMDSIVGITAEFFDTVHIWLPFISKKRMELALHKPDLELKADLALLILAMKLVTEKPVSFAGSAQTRLYWVVKSQFSILESCGGISLYTLQCSILITVYEIGHGIYPAAYLSAGKAARLGQALGLDNRSAPQMLTRRFGAWAQLEEVKRAWWTVMLLDRFVNLGIDGHSLATDDPRETDALPADDDLWNQGEISAVENLYVASPAQVKASPFARTCQATNLLGKYIRHRNDRTSEPHIHFGEAMQLHRVLSAFSQLLLNEVVHNPLGCSTAIAIGYTALIHLYDPYSCTNYTTSRSTSMKPTGETEMQVVAIAGLKSTAADILSFSGLISTCMNSKPDAVSPLVIECLYQGASTFAWLVYESGSTEMASMYQTFISILKELSDRWTLASEYLKILDRTKEVMFENSPLL